MTPLEAALYYASRGLRVLPLWWITEAGYCACAQGPNCGKKSGKHPVLNDWVSRATIEERFIRGWWTEMPKANVGIATGAISGIFVVDVDPGNGGDASLAEWEAENGVLTVSSEAHTGSGGRHIFYRYPPGGVRSRNPWLKGVEIKSDGGQVVAWPSTNRNGPYYWEQNGATGFSDPPPLLVESAGLPGVDGSHGPSELAPSDEIEVIQDGARNDTLFRLACRYRRQLRDDYPAVFGAVMMKNVQTCAPPLEEEEVTFIIDQAFKMDHTDDPAMTWARAQTAPTPTVIVNDDGEAVVHTPPTDFDENNLPCTDMGNARRFALAWQHSVRYAQGLGWVVWDGTRWNRDELNTVQELAKDTARSILTEAVVNEDEDVREELARWAKMSQSQRSVSATMSLASSETEVAAPSEAFDSDPWLLNCTNGTVDLRTAELAPHAQMQYITKIVGTAFVPEAQCPRWHKFLAQIVPDPDVREFIRRAVGYSLTGVTSEKVMLILYGAGNNGKSVFLEVLRQVLGEYAASTPTSMFVNRKGDSIPNDIARLRSARFVTASETEKGARMDATLVKTLTGGDKVTARFMRQEFFEFTPELKLWLATNHPPRTNDFGEALWSRLRFVPFTVAIPKEEQIARHELEAALFAEAEGILAWAVHGAMSWQKEGTLTEPLAVMLATSEQRIENDYLLRFVDDSLDADPRHWVPLQDVYNTYLNWWMAMGEPGKPLSQRWLVLELQERMSFLEQETRNSLRGWKGVRVRSAHTMADGI